MTLCCCVFGAWSLNVYPYRLQQQSLAVVNRLNGQARSVPEVGSRWRRWLVTTLLGDDAFNRIDDVDLANRNVDDDALRSLAGLRHLKKLRLDYTHITDRGLATLQSMPDLTRLSLKYTSVSDAGAQYMSTLSKLQLLILTGSKVSDAAVDDLSKLTEVKSIYIRWTRISNAGADRLRQALPNCEVYHHALTTEVAATLTH